MHYSGRQMASYLSSQTSSNSARLSSWRCTRAAATLSTSARREIGLTAMLSAALTLLKYEFLLAEDFNRLTQTISGIRREFRYEDVDFDTMRAVSVSLVRAECVKLAVALKDRIADDGTLQAWIDEAKVDPLPEVRFSLVNS